MQELPALWSGGSSCSGGSSGGSSGGGSSGRRSGGGGSSGDSYGGGPDHVAGDQVVMDQVARVMVVDLITWQELRW